MAAGDVIGNYAQPIQGAMQAFQKAAGLGDNFDWTPFWQDYVNAHGSLSSTENPFGMFRDQLARYDFGSDKANALKADFGNKLLDNPDVQAYGQQVHDAWDKQAHKKDPMLGGFGSVLGGIVGGLAGGPIGSGIGASIGAKLDGADNRHALVAGATSYAGGELLGGGTAPTTVGEAVTRAFDPTRLAISAGINAGGQLLADRKLDPSRLALGTFTGAVGGAAGGIVGLQSGSPILGQVAGGFTGGVLNRALTPAFSQARRVNAPGILASAPIGAAPSISGAPSFSTALPQFMPKYTRGAYDPTQRGEVNGV